MEYVKYYACMEDFLQEKLENVQAEAAYEVYKDPAAKQRSHKAMNASVFLIISIKQTALIVRQSTLKVQQSLKQNPNSPKSHTYSNAKDPKSNFPKSKPSSPKGLNY